MTLASILMIKSLIPLMPRRQKKQVSHLRTLRKSLKSVVIQTLVVLRSRATPLPSLMALKIRVEKKSVKLPISIKTPRRFNTVVKSLNGMSLKRKIKMLNILYCS